MSPMPPPGISPFSGLDALVQAASVESERERRRLSAGSDTAIHSRPSSSHRMDVDSSMEMVREKEQDKMILDSTPRSSVPHSWEEASARHGLYDGTATRQEGRRRSSASSSASLRGLINPTPTTDIQIADGVVVEPHSISRDVHITPRRALSPRPPAAREVQAGSPPASAHGLPVQPEPKVEAPDPDQLPSVQPVKAEFMQMQRSAGPSRAGGELARTSPQEARPRNRVLKRESTPPQVNVRTPTPKLETKQMRKLSLGGEDDPHEWLLEHYAGESPRAPEPPHSEPPSPPPEHRQPTHVLASPAQTRREDTATPVVLSTPLPPSPNSAKELEDELVAAVEPEPESRFHHAGMDMDVDDELLSLVDDQHRPRSSTSSSTRQNTSSPAKAKVSPTPVPSTVPRQKTGVTDNLPLAESTQPAPTSSSQKKKPIGKTKAKEPKEAKATAKLKAKAPAKPKGKGKTSAPGTDAALTLADIAPGLTTTGRTKKVPVFRRPDDTLPAVSGKKGSGTAMSSSNQAPSRSRSTSVMPPSIEQHRESKEARESEVPQDDQDDEKLYCICKTQYDEDRIMIACDRCDEWYHTQCLKMPDLEVDLVDQFICPICVKNNPHLSLHTTWKQRCFYGLEHPDPTSQAACHKPARGLYSKYCSDECGLKLMQARIAKWSNEGGNKAGLWEKVKSAQKREGVTVRIEFEPSKDRVDDIKVGQGMYGARTEKLIAPQRSIIQREVDRLHSLLDQLQLKRDEINRTMDIVQWRERLVELADGRSERLEECGWDQRLCFGDTEVAVFGAGVFESYESVVIEDSAAETPGEDGEWWCRGKKKCERHAGWQKLRLTEVALEREIKEVALNKLTTRERELRKRMEDLLDPFTRQSQAAEPVRSQPVVAINGHGKAKPNGQTTKRGKKRKAE
ncbi:hypothetical protein PUNSTDRAFT_79448 [Punctularia strigosozonata HHB-11173 SS5]|uniref:uncharacterized protein n=1 Tax=Punctularia strigosozonata (strain HHB-11173) TaxID=741275 RepID=UPI000441793F|nr:uncharacterized protein PUNSTDRAFT_79448 [Punctularia strigosozonata HHB-11173 SS5]EIN13703.1 hypothetical protein PUNSTDRAFT_79448 [Punctularia strigosozonata HHB-11173 SS5]